MTTPALSVGIRKRGRHYPYPPVDPSGWTRNQWGSVDPDSIPDGVEVRPSITNILSVCGMGDGLLFWSGEHAIRAMYRDGFPEDVERAVELHKGAFRDVRDERAEAGTRAHTIAQALTDDLPLPADLSGEDEAFADAFMAFWAEHDPKPIYTEATVYGDLFAAGTGDLFTWIDGRVVALDYKTRGERDDKKLRRYGALYDKNRMQLAALARATEVAVPDGAGWTLEPAPEVEVGLGVVLFPDGTFVTEELDDVELDRWYRGFVGAHMLWQATKGVPA